MPVIEYNRRLWENFSLSSRKATIFNSWNWAELLIENYNYKAIYFYIGNIDEYKGIQFCIVRNILGKKKLISLPFSDYCSILFDDEVKLSKLLDEIKEYSLKNQIENIEIRDVINIKNYSKNNKSENVIHILKLNGKYEVLSKQFSDQVLRGIKKSIKENLSYSMKNDLDSIEEFYKLHLLTRKRQGIPIQPKKFFYLLYEKLLKERKGYIILIKKNNTTISGGLFLIHNKTFTYKYGASNSKYLIHRPNNLLFSVAIQEAIKKGCEIFDFGKTENENIGLRKFKSSWGAEEKKLFYTYFPFLEQNKYYNYTKDKLLSPLIRISPKFVCRLIGEILYKYHS